MTQINILKNSMFNLHEKTGKEFLSLQEIYDEFEKINGVPNANNGASIRRLLETHCKICDAFNGEELFISNGKGTGLYKFKYFDQLKFIKNMTIGDIFTRQQLMTIFKISGQSGMMKSNTLNCLILTTSEDNGIYDDSVIENGIIQYTGEGQIGDQKLDKNNKTLLNSIQNEIPVYLFSKDKQRRYIFE